MLSIIFTGLLNFGLTLAFFIGFDYLYPPTESLTYRLKTRFRLKTLFKSIPPASMIVPTYLTTTSTPDVLERGLPATASLQLWPELSSPGTIEVTIIKPPQPTKHATFEQAVESFLSDVAAGHPPTTAKTYRVGLNSFARYLTGQLNLDVTILEIGDLQTDWVIDWVRWLIAGQPNHCFSHGQGAGIDTPVQAPADPCANKAASRSTVGTYLSGVIGFYRWCVMEGMLILPLEEFQHLLGRLKTLRGKLSRPSISKLPADETLKELLDQARHSTHLLPTNFSSSNELQQPPSAQNSLGSSGTTFLDPLVSSQLPAEVSRQQLSHLRNIALLETLQSTGARVSEITGLVRGDLDDTNRRARVLGKGSKERWVYFSPAAWQALQDYLTTRSLHISQAPQEQEQETRPKTKEPLFSRHDYGASRFSCLPLQAQAVSGVINKLKAEAGVSAIVTPHRYRHWFATRMLAVTNNLATVQDLLGHSSPTTTRIYAQVSETAKQEAHHTVFC